MRWINQITQAYFEQVILGVWAAGCGFHNGSFLQLFWDMGVKGVGSSTL
jgi:hypothetical protein